jgi:hypothetical protein
MSNRAVDTAPYAYARIAGALYLVVIVMGLFAEGFVRGRLTAFGDAAATADGILADELLFRLGLAAGIVLLVCNVPLTLVFYHLFKVVHQGAAALVACFLLLGTAVESVSLLFHHAPLVLLGGTDDLAALDAGQAQALTLVSLRLREATFTISLVFFACYCLLAGYLVLTSTFLPRAVGALLVVAGACYLTNGLAYFLAPGIAARLVPFILVPCFVAELSLSLRLLLGGVDATRWRQRAAATSGGDQRPKRQLGSGAWQH